MEPFREEKPQMCFYFRLTCESLFTFDVTVKYRAEG